MVQDYEHFIIVDTTAILFPQTAVVIVISPATMKGLYQENRKLKLWSIGMKEVWIWARKRRYKF